MDRESGIVAQFLDWFWSDPLLGSAAVAAVIAMATTPIAFIILSRTEYLHTRRGRTYRKPEWWSVVCGMALVMAVPGIVLVLMVKSRYFDENRYAFDPNETWSVLEQGRRFENAKELSKAAEQEYERLQAERKRLVEGVKKLDEAMLALRAAADQAPTVAQTLPGVLEQLAEVRRAVGVDAPQQLVDYTAPPIDLARMPPPAAPYPYPPMMVPAGADVGASAGVVPTATPAGPGLTPAERQVELASVPEPQRELAGLLPLSNLPEGWDIGQSGDRYVETFNAENLYEKINGRAESFIQYDVEGMAYTFYHPAGDTSNEVQLYIFEFPSALNALGKYGSEKPDEAEPLELGAEGYASGVSVFFHAKSYYVQIVPTSDSTEFRDFALTIARRISNEIMPGSAPEAEPETSTAVASTGEPASDDSPMSPSEPAQEPEAEKEVDPSAIFALLPDGPGKSSETYVAQDVFGYAFLADVFMADYAEGDLTWQGFVRPYASPERAKEIFDQYRAEAEAFDAQISEVETDAADAMYVAENFGLVDVIFLKGNAVAGVNGSTDVETAKGFALNFAESMPATSPHLDTGDDSSTAESASESSSTAAGG